MKYLLLLALLVGCDSKIDQTPPNTKDLEKTINKMHTGSTISRKEQ